MTNINRVRERKITRPTVKPVTREELNKAFAAYCAAGGKRLILLPEQGPRLQNVSWKSNGFESFISIKD